uniref:hypothetical protein n=1 Tax=Mariniflexile sp. TaxID=1979402 RepID=UPI00404781F0
MNLKVLSANGNYLGYFKNNTNQIDSEGYDNTPVTITFNEDTFSGNTPRNSFFGEFNIGVLRYTIIFITAY